MLFRGSIHYLQAQHLVSIIYNCTVPKFILGQCLKPMYEISFTAARKYANTDKILKGFSRSYNRLQQDISLNRWNFPLKLLH